MDCTPVEPKIDEWITCTATVLNNSTVNIPGVFQTSIQGSLATITGLDAGATKTATVQNAFSFSTPGKHFLNFLTDATGVIDESNETNNVIEKLFNILPSTSPVDIDLNATCPFTFTRDLTIGSRGTDVVVLQKFLRDKGFLIITGDLGYFGSQTKTALALYQNATGISPADGSFGPVTRAAMNADCAISYPPSIIVLTPNGGEVWSRGAQKTLNWSANNGGYFTGGTLHMRSATGEIYNLGSLTFDTDNFLWTVGQSMGGTIPDGQYYFRICAFNVCDESDASLTITSPVVLPTISVIHPSSKDMLNEGSQFKINWTARNIPKDAKALITVFHGDEASGEYPNKVIANGLAYNATSYTWKVETDKGWSTGVGSLGSRMASLFGAERAFAEAGKYRIEVRYHNSSQGFIGKGVSGAFTINPIPEAPTASLTVDGEKAITVPYGKLISFEWISTNADKFSATYKTNNKKKDAARCGNGSIAGINGASGTYQYQAWNNAKYIGCDYTVTYTATQSKTGKIAKGTVRIKIAKKVSASPSNTASAMESLANFFKSFLGL